MHNMTIPEPVWREDTIQQAPQERDSSQHKRKIDEDQEVNTCPELDALIPDTVKVTPGSTSKSLIVMGERLDRAVVMKISFTPKADGDNSLIAEGRITNCLQKWSFRLVYMSLRLEPIQVLKQC